MSCALPQGEATGSLPSTEYSGSFSIGMQYSAKVHNTCTKRITSRKGTDKARGRGCRRALFQRMTKSDSFEKQTPNQAALKHHKGVFREITGTSWKNNFFHTNIPKSPKFMDMGRWEASLSSASSTAAAPWPAHLQALLLPTIPILQGTIPDTSLALGGHIPCASCSSTRVLLGPASLQALGSLSLSRQAQRLQHASSV